MPLNFFRPVAATRRHLNMFYLLDTSGSMNNAHCIQQLNSAMRDIVPILREVSSANRDHSDIYLSCISFGTEAKLLYRNPVLIDKFEWIDVRAEGLTNLGAAFMLLNEQMKSRKTFGHGDGNLRSAVILMTDGQPDSGWQEQLTELQSNPWFREAFKIAITVGPQAAHPEVQDVMWHFATPLDAGDDHLVIHVSDLARIGSVLRFVSSVVSRVGSQNYGSPTAATGQIADAIEGEFKDEGVVLIFDRAGNDRKPHY